MQTNIHPELVARADVAEADAILRKCVHCGFCTAACPTYQLLGDELDGPRGRIYLIKGLLETGEISAATGQHLDRCLTCRSCETACPSGVEYGRLLDIGKGVREERGGGGWRRIAAWFLRQVVPRRVLFSCLLAVGQAIRPVLPAPLKRRIPPPGLAAPPVAKEADPDVLLLGGCVQSVATPAVNRALAHLLAIKGMKAKLVEIPCCGALDYHLAAHESGMARMKKVMAACAEAPGIPVVSSATGCGVTLKEYGDIFRRDGNRAEAASFSGRVVDASELFDPGSYSDSGPDSGPDSSSPAPLFDCAPLRVSVHTPCTMQHGMKLVGRIERILRRSGFDVLATRDGHLCCGSAGTYSILQPELSRRLLGNKVAALTAPAPDVIVTANVGCQLHLGAGSDIPVMHWAELLYRQLR